MARMVKALKSAKRYNKKRVKEDWKVLKEIILKEYNDYDTRFTDEELELYLGVKGELPIIEVWPLSESLFAGNYHVDIFGLGDFYKEQGGIDETVYTVEQAINKLNFLIVAYKESLQN